MTVIRPVGGILGKRPTGAAFRTGVWKQPEVFERRQDGVWQIPTYPELAPYATNANGEILVGTHNPGKPSLLGFNKQGTTDYVKPRKKYPGAGAALDISRFNFLFSRAVTQNQNWRFDIRYYDQPTGPNAFGRTVQSANCKRVMSGNSCWNMDRYEMAHVINPGAGWDFFYFYHDEGYFCDLTGLDYSLISTDGSNNFIYHTSDQTSSARYPFGQATFRGTDTVFRPGVGTVTAYKYYDTTEVGRPVSMWLLPP